MPAHHAVVLQNAWKDNAAGSNAFERAGNIVATCDM